MPTTEPTYAPWVEEARGRTLDVEVLPEAREQLAALGTSDTQACTRLCRELCLLLILFLKYHECTVPELRFYKTAEEYLGTIMDILSVGKKRVD